MKTVIVLVMFAALGCANYQDSRKVARVGGYVMIAGASLVAVSAGILANAGDEPAPTGTGLIGFGIEVVGLVIFAPGLLAGSLGLVGMGIHDKSPPPPSTEMFCTTSPVATSVCFCSISRKECETRRRAIEAGGGTMNACVVEPQDRCH